ncbi:RCC1 domain-containing protein 1 [Engystomops pustulosus]|uniref:RCC1 domain-containing protein 1 n=1 Tax=Engystomops pustulosus TaxID=76066 RepID=UPI003AFA9239
MLCYGCGFSGFGQLRSGEEIAVTLPVRITGAAETHVIRRAAPSWSYTALVTDDGALLLSGCISGTPQQSIVFPALDCQDVLPSEKYLLILVKGRAECWDVTHLDCDGSVPEPMWKMEICDIHSNAFPLVAHGYVLPQPPFFRELSPSLQAQTMALGNEHAVLLTRDGKVLSWGAGRHGQLGHGDVEDVSEPRIVEALHGVTMSQVAAGGWHTVSISESGDLYSWGWNESGQLGLPAKSLHQGCCTYKETTTECEEDEGSEFIGIQSFPALIDLPQETEATKVSCGSRHTAAVTRCGGLYTWGWGKYGQLGHGDTKTLDQPKRVEFFSLNKLNVKDVTCGHWNTYVMCVLEGK